MSQIKRKTPPTPNANAKGSQTKGQPEHPDLGNIGDHITKLRQVASTTETLVNFLGGQLQGLSVTIPILRGFEIVCARLRPIILVDPSRVVGTRT